MTKQISIQCPKCGVFKNLSFTENEFISEAFIRRTFARFNSCSQTKPFARQLKSSDEIRSPHND